MRLISGKNPSDQKSETGSLLHSVPEVTAFRGSKSSCPRLSDLGAGLGFSGRVSPEESPCRSCSACETLSGFGGTLPELRRRGAVRLTGGFWGSWGRVAW